MIDLVCLYIEFPGDFIRFILLDVLLHSINSFLYVVTGFKFLEILNASIVLGITSSLFMERYAKLTIFFHF